MSRRGTLAAAGDGRYHGAGMGCAMLRSEVATASLNPKWVNRSFLGVL